MLLLAFLWRWCKERHPASLLSKLIMLNPRSGWGTWNQILVSIRMARTEDLIWRRKWKGQDQSSFLILRAWNHHHHLWGNPCHSLESRRLSNLQQQKQPHRSSLLSKLPMARRIIWSQPAVQRQERSVPWWVPWILKPVLMVRTCIVKTRAARDLALPLVTNRQELHQRHLVWSWWGLPVLSQWEALRKNVLQ